MKARQFWLVVIITAVFVFTGILEVRGQAQKDERESYRKQVEEKLREFEKKIKVLKQQAGEVKAEAKTKYNEEMNDVKGKHKTAKNRLRGLKEVGAREWNKAKTEMDTALHKLESVYEKAAARFKADKIKE
jgi:peptidoglycan hydrolase CwlO-like protein